MKTSVKQYQDLSLDELSKVKQMRDVVSQQKAVQSPRLGSVADASITRSQAQGPPNLISYPEQPQTLPKEMQEPQPACIGLNLPSNTSGVISVWTITPVIPSGKHYIIIH